MPPRLKFGIIISAWWKNYITEIDVVHITFSFARVFFKQRTPKVSYCP